MSRNLCRTDCRFCGGRIELREPERDITPSDCGAYFQEYRGMRVAAAACFDCDAQYLAWMAGGQKMSDYWARREDGGPVDLSFRHSFNDEPALEDLPKYEIEVRRVRIGAFDIEANGYGHLLKRGRP